MASRDMETLAKLNTMIRIMPGPSLIMALDETLEIVASNREMWNLCDCETEEEFLTYYKSSGYELMSDIDRPGMMELIQNREDRKLMERHRYVYRIVTKTGKQIIVEDCGGVLPPDGGEPFVLSQFTVSHMESIESPYFNDRLTGTLSQEEFVANATQILKDAKERGELSQYAVCYINIRNFKFYNMKYGREEGDSLLQSIAFYMKNAPEKLLVRRALSDHFICLSKGDDILEKEIAQSEIFRKEYAITGVSFKVGIYQFKDELIDITDARDRAKIAADAIYNEKTMVMLYDEKLEKQVRQEEFIAEHFEEALEKGYIEPFYQPVVRTISNTVCSTEALARWIDPQIGFIPPGDFIPVLEKNNLIVNLDLHILEHVCKNMRSMAEKNMKILPTSFNLSRQDFIERDMLSEIERILEKYAIARDLVILDITESMVMENPEQLRIEIQRFQKKGYQVWMDDFGSAYSSLNMLKDFPFDELKLDMNFMRSFDEKSKEIIKSNVRMAKNLGIQTLAEGVETQEQYEFLREIGCEKVQGYYISRPIPKNEVLAFAKKTCFGIENRAIRSYYDALGRVDKMTDRSLAILEFDQEKFHILYMNKEFEEVYQSLDIGDMSLLNSIMNGENSNLAKKFRDHQKLTESTDDFVDMDYSSFGHYFRLRSKKIASQGIHVANQIEIINLTKLDEADRIELVDQTLRTMYVKYDVIRLMRPDGTAETIALREKLDLFGKEQVNTEEFQNSAYLKKLVHPEDQEEFLKFVDRSTLRERLSKHGGIMTRFFRTGIGRKNFVWKEHTYQYVPETDVIIYSSKEVPLFETDANRRAKLKTKEEEESLIQAVWGTLRDSKMVGYCVKDRNRRIIEANQKFLELHGLQEAEDFLGKTAWENHWMIDDAVAERDDKLLLEKGGYIRNHSEPIVVNGVVHNLIVSKEAIYRGNEIIGILVQFLDADELSKTQMTTDVFTRRDKITGLLNAQGMLEQIPEMVEGLRNRHEKFAILRIQYREQQQNYEEYGLLAANEIAQYVAGELKGIISNKSLVARLYAGVYVILEKYEEESEPQELVKRIKERFGESKKIAGAMITFYPEITLRLVNQMEDTRNVIALATGGLEEDVRERKRLEDKLDYYNLQMEAVIDSMSGGIMMYDIAEDDIQIVYASKGIEEIAGKPIESIVEAFQSNRAEDLIDEDKKLFEDAVYRTLHYDEPLHLSFRVRHATKGLVWVDMKGQIVRRQDGHALLLAIYQNLTETTSSYEHILDESLSYITVFAKKDNELLYANQAARAASEIQAGGSLLLLHDQITELCIEEQRAEGLFGEQQDKVRYEIELNGRRLLVYRSDGMWNGREAIISYVSDITGKYLEEREKELQESRLYLEAVNASYDVIVTYNLTKNYYNIYPEDAILGHKFKKYDTYDELVQETHKYIRMPNGVDVPDTNTAMQIDLYMKGMNHTYYEYEMADSDGKYHWMSDRVVYLEDPKSGDILAMSMTSIIDELVAERISREEDLQNALEDAKRANQAKTQFLSNMSHDIRTPMNAIVGYSNVAMEHMDDSDRVKECLENIVDSGNHLQTLINDVLDMSRIESGKESLNLETVSLISLSREVIAIMKPMVGLKNITLKMDAKGVKHNFILADASKLKRIYINVLSNAVNYTGVGGEVTCRIREEKTEKDNVIRYSFSIIDSGVGMSDDFAAHIFDLFSREQSTTDSRVPGFGLGMAIVKRYVELMGGTIQVTSKKNVGTTVSATIDFEVAEEKPETPNIHKNSMDVVKGMRALIVDDNETNRAIAEIMLTDMGVTVDMVNDGLEAVNLLYNCEDQTYDFVLMDVLMPEMDGLEATRRIRASERAYLKEVPIFALTANAFAEDMKASMDAGMTAHIAKPFSKMDIVKNVIMHITDKK